MTHDPDDPRHRPTEAPPEPLRLPVRSADEITGPVAVDVAPEPPTAPLPIDREALARPTMSIPPPKPGPFGPPPRAPLPPRAPSEAGRRAPPREPSRSRPLPQTARPVRDYPVARALLKHPEAAQAEDRPLSAAVPRAFVRGGVPVEGRGSAREAADGMLEHMAEGLLVGGDGAGNSEIRVTLGEEFFGGTELQIVHTAEGLVAILRPPDREAFRVLSDELPRLRAHLEERGLRVSNLRVEEP